jgi:hypothetical protein
MDYLEALKVLHARLAPANYFEIGCRNGVSLSLAGCASIAVDPDPAISVALHAPTRLFKETSDAFFARPDIAAVLGSAIDFAFIDGLHNAEYALRDFMNVEAHSHPGGIVAIDDVLPQKMEYATRTRLGTIWCGDVYKIVAILRRYRPDLHVDTFDIDLKGLCLVSGLDPTSRILWEAYEHIAADIANQVYDIQRESDLRALVKPQEPGTIFTHIERLGRLRSDLITRGGAVRT